MLARTPEDAARRSMTAAAAAIVLGATAACSTPPAPLPAAATPTLPAAWQAPLPPVPAGAAGAADPAWWSRFDDPLLASLIASAQAASADLAAATARIEAARAARAAAAAALLPRLDGVASAQRGRELPTDPLATAGVVGVQAAWEIDVFGGRRADRDAAEARLDAAQAGWHALHVALAAETASTYVALRACEAQAAQTDADVASRAETARLSAAAADAGMLPPADAALARGSAAQARTQQVQQRAACERIVKGLVALTAHDEPALRAQLMPGTARLPQPARFALAALPAALLLQRPDLAAAGHAVQAAASDQAAAAAARLPRIGLAGWLGTMRVATAPATVQGSVWSIGPLQLSLPVFDAGARAANESAARAAYDAAIAQYAAALRTAVREVEDALVVLRSTEDRRDDAQIAVDGLQAALDATERRQRGGLASLFDLEDARRGALTARSALVELERERVAAWIALYRALGGGWRDDMAAASPSP